MKQTESSGFVHYIDGMVRAALKRYPQGAFRHGLRPWVRIGESRKYAISHAIFGLGDQIRRLSRDPALSYNVSHGPYTVGYRDWMRRAEKRLARRVKPCFQKV